VLESQPYVNAVSELGISYGFLALYIFILTTVGGAVRNVLLGNADRIMLTEMPEPQDLMDICEGIYIVRIQGESTAPSVVSVDTVQDRSQRRHCSRSMHCLACFDLL
jgi:hypothetical protein